MEKYYFVYSVDAVTISGVMDMYGMILDHPELWDTINAVKSSGGTISAVSVTMYDHSGHPVCTRDITQMFVQSR